MRLNQVTLPCRDLDRGIAFYQLLGLRLIVDSRPDYARLLCPDGDSTLSLHRVDGTAGDFVPVIYFEHEQLDTEVERLSAAGVVFDTPPTDQSWLWREASLRDPDGNRLILFHAGHNRLNPPWRLTDQ